MIQSWFCLLKEKYNCTIMNFEIYPDALFIIFIAPNDSPINKIIANGKRFMAYEIIFRLKCQQEFKIIKFLNKSVSKSERKKGQIHKVFK